MRGLKIFRFVALFALMAFVALVQAEALAREVGQITSTEGRVDIKRGNSEEAVRLKEDQAVQVGDVIRTKTGSRTEITFSDKTIIRIAPDSRVCIERYDLDENGNRETANLRLFRGKMRAIVSKSGPSESFNILTPGAKGTAKGTDIFAFYQADSTGFLVKEGKLDVLNQAFPDEVKEIRKGDIVSIPLTEVPTEGRPFMDAELSLHENDTTPTFVSKLDTRSRGVKELRGKIETMNGDVKVINKGQEKSHGARKGEMLEEGDRVETGENSKAKIVLENGNILFMQPDTEIQFITLRQNLKTGEYDNLFESKYGKIKAVVEKLGKKSTFKVKTPSAVCGVRGTVMYLDIQQVGPTTALFEGGAGDITSLSTGDMQAVGSGQHSNIDIMGNISSPMAAGIMDRMEMQDAWEAGAARDSYFSLEGGTTTGLLTREQIASIIADVELSIAEGGRMGADLITQGPLPADMMPLLFDFIRENPPTEVINFSGRTGGVNNSGEIVVDPLSQINGEFRFSPPPVIKWGAYPAPTAATIDGLFRNPGDRKMWVADADWIRGSTSDGGRFAGRMGGTIINGVFRGKFLGIYIDSTTGSGTFSSLLIGTANAVTDIIEGAGVSNFTEREVLGVGPSALDSLAVVNGELHSGSGLGNFVGGTLQVNSLSGDTFSINNKNWGLWFMSMKGTYVTPTTESWTCGIGGKHTDSYGTGGWIGTLDGKAGTGWLAGGSVRASFNGMFFSDGPSAGDVSAGKIANGDVIGDHWIDDNNTPLDTGDDIPSWEALGGGEWAEITNLLTEAGMGFTVSNFNAFTNFSVIENNHAVMNAISGYSGGIFNAGTNMQMDLRFYSNTNGDRLWTGDLAGVEYTGAASPGWTMDLTGTGGSITLQNGVWNGDGTWRADVNPINDAIAGGQQDITAGQMAGTYADGQMQGVGGGTWDNGPA